MNAETTPSGETVISTDSSPAEEKDYLFSPPPSEILISCKNGHKRLYPGMEMYDYVYKRINERVADDGTVEMPDTECDIFNVYRANKETYVDFSYNTPGEETKEYTICLDNNDPDSSIPLNYLFFPLSGKATNAVLVNSKIKNEESETAYYETKCYGPLSTDQELIDAIWKYIDDETVPTASP